MTEIERKACELLNSYTPHQLALMLAEMGAALRWSLCNLTNEQDDWTFDEQQRAHMEALRLIADFDAGVPDA